MNITKDRMRKERGLKNELNKEIVVEAEMN